MAYKQWGLGGVCSLNLCLTIRVYVGYLSFIYWINIISIIANRNNLGGELISVETYHLREWYRYTSDNL